MDAQTMVSALLGLRAVHIIISSQVAQDGTPKEAIVNKAKQSRRWRSKGASARFGVPPLYLHGFSLAGQ